MRKVQLIAASLLASMMFFSCESNNTAISAENTASEDTAWGDVKPSDLINNPRTLDSSNANVDLPTITFDKIEHDFGTVNEGDVPTFDFEFTNTGTKPLIISSVRAACGCTTPEKPNDPILPGKRSKIKVAFDSEGRPGTHTKDVAVSSNASNPEVTITIKVNVNPKKK